jgi:hypothetical protein
MAFSPFFKISGAADVSEILDPSAPNSSKSPADAGEPIVHNKMDPASRVEAMALAAFVRQNILLFRWRVISFPSLSCSVHRRSVGLVLDAWHVAGRRIATRVSRKGHTAFCDSKKQKRKQLDKSREAFIPSRGPEVGVRPMRCVDDRLLYSKATSASIGRLVQKVRNVGDACVL